MRHSRAPFAERGGPLRGVLDLLTGRYPSFLFGGGTSGILPVFHLHEAAPDILESRLCYLADNGYRTITSDAVEAFVRRGVHPGPRAVALCFDDCLASLWTVAGPLLRRYDMQAIAFAIPARVDEAPAVRPTINDRLFHADAVAADSSTVPFSTWPELQHLQAEGLVDIQSHTMTHTAMFCGPSILGFVSPSFSTTKMLNRPTIMTNGRSRPLTPADLGSPLYVHRSRMSDAVRYYDDAEARERCMALVAEGGGQAFFSRPDWRRALMRCAGAPRGRWESAQERTAAITAELQEARDVLEARLGSPVRRICLPWGIGGRETKARLSMTGYHLAFVDRLFGYRAVRAKESAFGLMRLHERFIHCLPGRGRRWFVTAT